MKALEEEKLKISSPKTPQNGRSVKGFWGKSTKIRKLWETRKEIIHQKGWNNRGSGTQGAKGGNQWYPKTLEWHYKRISSQYWTGQSVVVNHNRIIEKNLSKYRKSSKRKRNTPRYPNTATIEYTRIQKDSNFASLGGLNSHLSLRFLSLFGPCNLS